MYHQSTLEVSHSTPQICVNLHRVHIHTQYELVCNLSCAVLGQASHSVGTQDYASYALTPSENIMRHNCHYVIFPVIALHKASEVGFLR